MKVDFAYYKPSGKYYSSGSAEVEGELFADVLLNVLNMLKQGTRPGLVDGYDFDVHVTVHTPHGEIPALFTRERFVPQNEIVRTVLERTAPDVR
jgi:hypothetical protein